MKIHLNSDGTIHAIGYVDTYPHNCPNFINMENFTTLKCVNFDDISNPESWVEIENKYEIN
jgi:hypothetical protein